MERWQMPEWQQRVLAERSELADRLTKLAAFISRKDPAFVALELEDQRLLRWQRETMTAYHDTLTDRIDRFPSENPDF